MVIVLTTGYDHHRYEAMFAKDERVLILAKPFDAPQLLWSLNSLKVSAGAARS